MRTDCLMRARLSADVLFVTPGNEYRGLIGRVLFLLGRGVVPPGRTTPRGRVGGRGRQRSGRVVARRRIPRM